MPKKPTNVLRAVLFTDVVGSTELAHEMGDARWTRLLEAQRRVVREQLRLNRGREIDTAGDGFLAVFEGPGDAVRCAFAIARKVQELGVNIRAGVHFGEIETSGTDVHGIVVHTGARVMSKAGAGEVLVTQTVKDLVAGATIEVQERDVFDLKGVPGTWVLFDVLGVDGEARTVPVATEETAGRRHLAAAPGLRSRTRRVLAISAAFVVVTAGVIGYLVFRPKPTYVPAAGTIARISGDRFEEPISVGEFPTALTEGNGRVWVLDRQTQVSWVNELDHTTGSRGTDGVPTGAVSGGNAIWITAGFGSGQGVDATVSRLDPASTQLTPAFQTPVDSQAITYGAGAVWVASPNTGEVTRYDPLSTAKPQTIKLPGEDAVAYPDSIAFGGIGGDAVWIGDSLSATIYRLDVSSKKINSYTVRGAPTAIAVGAGAVWIVSEQADAVYALDPTSGAPQRTIDVGSRGCNAPTTIAINKEAVWITCSASQRVIGIDPARGAVSTSLAVAGTPAALTTAKDGSVWAAVQPR